jgi:NH3-dependent NAD+ synthetase
MDYLERLDNLLGETDGTRIQLTIEAFLKNTVSEKKADGVVFGLSGGIDSVKLHTWLQKHLEKKH